MADHYATLGLSRTASEQDVKAAYRKLAKKLHPDKNLGNKERSTEMFKKVCVWHSAQPFCTWST